MNRVEYCKIEAPNSFKLDGVNYEPSTIYGYGHKSYYEDIVKNFNNKKIINKNLDQAKNVVKLIDELINSK